MVPKAPWIWPMWASSRTATRAAPGLTRMVMGRPPWPNRRRRRAALRLLGSYALAQRFEIAVWVLLGAAVETPAAVVAGGRRGRAAASAPPLCAVQAHKSRPVAASRRQRHVSNPFRWRRPSGAV